MLDCSFGMFARCGTLGFQVGVKPATTQQFWPCRSRSVAAAENLPEIRQHSHLHAPSLFSHPITGVDLTTGPNDEHDDDNAALQAALLESIGAGSQHETPARVCSGHQAHDHSEKKTQCNTSLAARTLRSLALDPPCTGAELLRSPPTIAGVIDEHLKCPCLFCSCKGLATNRCQEGSVNSSFPVRVGAVDCSPPGPMVETAFRKIALFRPIDPMDRVSAAIIPDFTCYQQKVC